MLTGLEGSGVGRQQYVPSVATCWLWDTPADAAAAVAACTPWNV
jgi:hypothetical protein